jgi:hypothetical protein
MLVQWCVVELPDDELPEDAPELLELVALVSWAGVAGELEVLAVAAEIPRPRLSPIALAAMPAASQGCLSFIVFSS